MKGYHVGIIGASGRGRTSLTKAIELAAKSHNKVFLHLVEEGPQIEDVSLLVNQATLIDSPYINDKDSDKKILIIEEPRRRCSLTSRIATLMAITHMPEMMECDRVIREVSSYQAPWEPNDKYSIKPKLTFDNARQPYDKRFQTKRYRHSK